MRASTYTCIGDLQSTSPSFASSPLATGRADAQAVELANLRQQNTTFSNDVRMNNIRQGIDGPAGTTMGLLQFAQTLQAASNGNVAGDNAETSGAKPFDPMAALAAMNGADGSAAPAPRLEYGGEEAAKDWARQWEKREKEKKRKKKEKKRAKKKNKKAKIEKLMTQQNMTLEAAKAAVESLSSSSESDSSSSED